MTIFASIVIHTANVLGILNDPFEFDGDYGPEVNPIRKRVFEQVVSREALNRTLTDLQVVALLQKSNLSETEIANERRLLILQGVQADKNHGPKLSQLVPESLFNILLAKKDELAFDEKELQAISLFLTKYGDQKVFYFLRNNPPELLSLDKALRDQSAREGRSFDLPILGSIGPLNGSGALELKNALAIKVFTHETLGLTKPANTVAESLQKLEKGYLKKYLGDKADNEDLQAFASPLGQLFFYWMYQALNLHLTAEDRGAIASINKVKEIFKKTLGDPEVRARELKRKLQEADNAVLFTQECDAVTIKALTADGEYLPVTSQNQQDGTLVFLRRAFFEEGVEVLRFDGYEGFQKGRINALLAKRKEGGDRYFLASCHGHSSKAEDGRRQITLIMEKFREFKGESIHLLIGTDANTKTADDVLLLREHLKELGLKATDVGVTTVKRRMVTAQHAKAGRFAADEEDYLITTKTEPGALVFSHETVGFKEGRADLTKPLPNIDNPSDHYPVGATMIPAEDKKMPLSYAVHLIKEWEKRGVNIWVDGGFGVDALLGRETRPHGDLDIALEEKDRERAIQYLQEQGFREIKRENPWNFVMRDQKGHEVDFHVFILDRDGRVVEGLPYPDGSLQGTGSLAGHPVRCITPEHMVRFHTGYPLRESDYQDVRALCLKFGVEYPEEYRDKM